MGVNRFSALMKKFPHSKWKTSEPVSSFKGQVWAVDISQLVYAAWSSAHRNVVLRTPIADFRKIDGEELVPAVTCSIINFAVALLGLEISPVFVFDGLRPELKGEHAGKRREAERLRKKKILREKEASLAQLQPLQYDTSKEDDLKKAYCAQFTIVPGAMSKIERTLSQLGLPCLQAPREADEACAALFREGYVHAVYSTDTDLLAWGVESVVSGLLGPKKPLKSKEDIKNAQKNNPGIKKPAYTRVNDRESVDCMHLAEVLTTLDLNHDQFIDLCIMAGVDYNENVKGFGICKAYNALIKLKSIEAIAAIQDLTTLNWKACREMFRPKSCAELWPQGFSCQVDVTKMRLSGLAALESVGGGSNFGSLLLRASRLPACELIAPSNLSDLVPQDVCDRSSSTVTNPEGLEIVTKTEFSATSTDGERGDIVFRPESPLESGKIFAQPAYLGIRGKRFREEEDHSRAASPFNKKYAMAPSCVHAT